MNEPANDTGSAILDRAIAAVRDGAIPEGPPVFTVQRTAAALWTAELRAAEARSRWVMRVAAAIVVGVCAAATGVVLVQRHQMLALRSGVTAPLPGGPVAIPQPTVAVVAPDADLLSVEPAPAQPPVSVASEVMLTGHVFLDGPTPPRREIDLGGYPLAIASVPGPVYDDSIVVNRDGTLANVVVSISGPLPADHEYPSPPPVVLDQKYCMFAPHVVAAMIGQRLVLRNSDPLPHNSHAVNSATATAFNFPVAGMGARTIEAFPAVDTFEVRSDLHPWMHGWVRVLDNPFFDVTRSDGVFSIKDLPAGKYTLHAWHEVLGEREKEITVSGGEPLVVDFTFESK